MKNKQKKSIMQELREIRDKISLETMDMNFEELKAYIAKNSKLHDASVWKTAKKRKAGVSIAAEPRAKYGKS